MTSDDRARSVERGRAARKAAPRSARADWTPAPDRLDPVTVLRVQDQSREPDLVPIRHGRMSASAFTFYRGSAELMAADLATGPSSGLTVQLSGDAHLSNLGLFGSPERQLLFGLNDFDETLPGPFEWDLLRLATSFTVVGDHRGLPVDVADSLARTCARSYRQAMGEFAALGSLDTWYSRTNDDDLMALVRQSLGDDAVRKTTKVLVKARSRTSAQATAKLTETVDGRMRFIDAPPLIVPARAMAPGLDPAGVVERVRGTFDQYRDSLSDSHRVLVDRFEFIDLAHKVVGVGSVGMRAFIVLLEDRLTGTPLVLQVKEAGRSALESYLGPSAYAHPGQRVVEGQRLLQATSDVFLGWSTGLDQATYYWRQLRDMKGSVDLEAMQPTGLRVYARLCGWTLARAHARSGDPVAISSYLGGKATADEAIAAFGRRYAAQNQADFDAHAQAIADGVLPAVVEA